MRQQEASDKSSTSSSSNSVGATLPTAGRDFFPQKERRRNRSGTFIICGDLSMAQVVRKLLQPKRHWFQELILQHEKRDVPYGICFIRKKQLTYPTSSHRSKQRSRMKINWNQVRKPVLQPQIDANNEKYPYLSFVNHIPQDPGECACRIKETDFICPHQQY